MSAAAAAGQPPRRPHAASARPDRTRAERRLGLSLVAPAVIVMIAVTAYPIIYAFVLSLQRADLRFPNANKFIGLDNYRTRARPPRCGGRTSGTP